MVKDVLKAKEPIVYLSLKNDLENSRLAQCYLLYGQVNPLKKDTAFLLAQSIIENKQGFACEMCNTCLRIKDNKYFDVIYVDGTKSSIKVDDIEYIMSEFSRTSLEGSKKVYIIDNINNASLKAVNMLLKFMEEPSGDDVYGIFISDDMDTLLDTIVSRCEKLPFMTRDFSYLINEYKEKGFEYQDAYILSNIKHDQSEIDLNDEAYLNAKEYVFKTIDNLDNFKYIPVLYSLEFYSCVSKDLFKKCSDYYLDIMILMIEDALSFKNIGDHEYDDCLTMINKHNPSKLLEIFLKAKERSNYPVNRQLLFDQIAFSIIS